MVNTLERRLGLGIVTLYGLGNILGAGIYVLVGKVSGLAGSGTELTFIVAMIVAAITAFSYMELSSRYPASASISVYLHKAFGRRWLSVAIGLTMVASGIASAATLSQGFAGYLNSLYNAPTTLASVSLLLILGLIAIKGIGESAKLAALFTLVEIFGLLLVIWVGRAAFLGLSPTSVINIDPILGLSGVFSGAFLAFYAFIGFEDMVNVAEETKDPKRTMPLAILISLIASTVLYLLVVIVATGTLSSAELSSSSAPLADVLERNGSNSRYIISTIGMVAAMNGVVVQLIMGSRILYGLSKQGWISSKLSIVSRKTGTPIRATSLILGCMITGTLLLPLISLAKISSFLVLSMFCVVNLSLLIIKKESRSQKQHVHFVVPSFVPYLGLLLCSLMIIYELLALLG